MRVDALMEDGVIMEGHALPILGTSAEQSPSNDRVARSIWWHRFGSLGAVHNKHSFDIPSDA